MSISTTGAKLVVIVSDAQQRSGLDFRQLALSSLSSAVSQGSISKNGQHRGLVEYLSEMKRENMCPAKVDSVKRGSYDADSMGG